MSPRTTARPEVMYSKAKPLALARSTMQPRVSSRSCSRLAGEDDVGAGEADAEARVGRALDEEAAALGAVGERLADRAVEPLALGALALEDRDRAAEHRLADAVLGAALDADRDAVGVEGAEALAGDRAAVELEAGEHVVVGLGAVLEDAGAGDRPGQLGAEHAVVGVGRARELVADRAARSRCRRRGRRSAPRPASPPSGSGGRRPGRPRRAPRPPPRRPAGRCGSRSRNSSSGVISGARSTLSWAATCSSRS